MSHDLKGIQAPANFASRFDVASGMEQGQIYYTVAMATLAQPRRGARMPAAPHRAAAQPDPSRPHGAQGPRPPTRLSGLAAPGGQGSRRHHVVSRGPAELVLNLWGGGNRGARGGSEKDVLCLGGCRQCESPCLAV